MHSVGVIHGRFQVLHNDHMVYLLAGKERCQHLVVGITNPDPFCTAEDATNPERSRPDANPLTYYERQAMLKAAFLAQGLSQDEFSLVPLPINYPERFKYYVPTDAVFFLTIYDEWGERKLALFNELGLRTEVMWRRPAEQKGISAATVRGLMAKGEPWEHLVPPAVAQFIRENGLDARIRELCSQNAA